MRAIPFRRQYRRPAVRRVWRDDLAAERSYSSS
jgi:hypothetical protein